ncbi:MULTISPECIES: SH3 domain-containing protein [Caldilinea]|jgi:hypothetical protein|uniref:SH3b domain-containing protein n=1 Tax=Caldilinea aerophila (strain DSM 14535 / JCM 11387 / NBRC 104270 / STL-6-O1) TaxID=926550 RepID=I0I407_CALAS|nr:MULTISPECIES: SH3 domain-containing protein [Caldilinea]MBO9393272.1 SH3 domain-containing protein [Caldilinea sp.]BAL99994.1 hypothetical protein CLDAP_19550 [Caldilinea aerophila DSM 14535 = NBRC 104270]GIV73337.1 MAG: hypothetical protein KatS3mg049_1893 [Caldilinea sp.]
MSRLLSHRYVRFAALAMIAVLLLATVPSAPAIATPALQQGAAPTVPNPPGFLVFGGTVIASPRLNVRDAPSINGRILGKLETGARVAVVGRSGGWYLIRYPAAPVGLGWVNASFVQLDGQPAPRPQAPQPTPRPTTQPPRPVRPAPPPPTPPVSPAESIRVEPPDLIDFNSGVFRWQWYGDQGLLRGLDWYFDLLLFFKGETLPYRVFVAEPGQVTRDGPFFIWQAEPFRVQCDTIAVARIAYRINGQFAGWVSDASEPIDVGPPCPPAAPPSSGGSSGGGGGDGGSACPLPDEEVTPELCDRPEFANCAPCRGG